MAKASRLSRRRGTLRSSRRKRSNYGLGIQVLICFALITGMAAGAALYLLYSIIVDEPPVTATTAAPERKTVATEDPAEELRKHVHSPHALVDKLVSENKDRFSDQRTDDYETKQDRKEHYGKRHNANDDLKEQRINESSVKKLEFMKHSVNRRQSGAFPHYPKTRLVEKDHDFTSFKPEGGHRFEEYKHGDSPYRYSPGESDELARSRLYHVKKAMQHAWAGYEKYAFGRDELRPVTKGGNMRWGGLGTTLVDSLDTLWLMGMKEEFYRARDWCKTTLNHDKKKDVSVFETTIRSLGGLLSAYDWSQDKVFLEQAEDLGKRLFQAFDTKSGIPFSQVNLSTGEGSNMSWSKGSTNVAEAGTLQLEFRALARFSGIKEYKSKSEKIFEILEQMKPDNGLYPIQIRNQKFIPQFKGRKVTFGAMSDSFYEYMLKIWIQGGKTEDFYREMYDESMQGMHDELLSVTYPSELVFIADKNGETMDYKMDHLVCFMGGLLALGAYTDPQGLESERAQRDLKTAKSLTYTCYQMYARMPTGLSPEFIQVKYKDEDFVPGHNGYHYLLRPEAVESFFILYHLTGDPVYREWGWEVFQAIERFCKTEFGYGQAANVEKPDNEPSNTMESFFLAETLKYLYLLFDPDTPIDLLHKHVFNTEAHPMRIFPVMDQEGVPDLLKKD